MDLVLRDVCVKELLTRRLSGGGFCARTGGGYRPDATAWAVISLAGAGSDLAILKMGRKRLAEDQMPDGRVAVSVDYPTAVWPTALAVLAWHNTPEFKDSQTRAVEFLLSSTGRHWKKGGDLTVGHDTSIRGWPWIEATHAWVEPTATALLALDLAGHGEHERAGEGRKMLLDRQMSTGGWNYGNTTIFGQNLRPMPDCTGIALGALAGKVLRSQVWKSLSYLKQRNERLSTPVSLGWAVLGLSAWDERPPETESALRICFERQDRFGAYETSQLALILAALTGTKGLRGLVSLRGS